MTGEPPGAGPPRPGRPVSGRDQYAKQIVHAGLAGILAQAGVHLDARALRAEPTELPANAQRADLVYADPRGVLVHVEIQTRPDPAMGRRMAEYAIRLAAADRAAPVTGLVQVLVQLTGPPMPTRYQLGGLTNDVHLLHVPTTPPTVLLGTPALAPLALLHDDPALVEAVVASIATVADPAEQADLVVAGMGVCPPGDLRVTLMEHARRMLMSEVIDDIVADLRRTDFGRDLITEGQRDILVRVLGRRFPDADPDRVARTVDRILYSDAGGDALEAVEAVTVLDA